MRGVEDPKPTGVCLYGGRPTEPPDLMLEVLRTPPLGESSEFRERLDPVLDGGREPLREPGWVDCLLVKPIMVSSAYPDPASMDALEDMPRLLSDFSLI